MSGRYYSKQAIGEPGDVVLFRIHMINTTEDALKGWSERIISQSNIVLISNRTIVVNSFNPNGVRVSDGIGSDAGINIGNYAKNGDAYVYSFYRIGEEKSTYTIIAECSAGHDTGTIYDYAEVIVESE